MSIFNKKKIEKESEAAEARVEAALKKKEEKDKKDKEKNENVELLARCEHNRWNIQQLLLGFIPADKEIDEKVQNKNGGLTNDELKKYKKEREEKSSLSV